MANCVHRSVRRAQAGDDLEKIVLFDIGVILVALDALEAERPPQRNPRQPQPQRRHLDAVPESQIARRGVEEKRVDLEQFL